MSQFHHFLTADDRQWYCWSCGGLMGSDGQVGCPGSIGFQVSRNSFFIHFYFCQTKLTTHESSQGPALSICIILIKFFKAVGLDLVCRLITQMELFWCDNRKKWNLCYASKSFKEFSTSWFFLHNNQCWGDHDQCYWMSCRFDLWEEGWNVFPIMIIRYFSIRNNIWSLKQQILIISAEVEGK